MARFQWFDGNQGIFGFDRFGAYLEMSRTAGGMVLAYDTANGVLNPTVMAARIELSFAGYAAVPVDSGPQAGGVQVVGGSVTGVRYFAADGSVLLEVTRLAVALPIALATLARGDGPGLWQMMTQGPNTLVGATSASGPQDGGSGDVIDTGGSADMVQGYGGDDYIQDRGGADSYNGGAGFDTLTYDSWFYRPYAITRGIVADLVLGTVAGPDGAKDTISGIEAVNGTFMNDSLKGNAAANTFIGFAGADRFDGRGGFDMVNYARDISQGGVDGIRVNLATGIVRDGFGRQDSLISIEGVEGTALADFMTDNGGDNFFSGGGGDDTLSFGIGNDTGRGGAGADSFIFRSPVFGDETIADFSQAQGDVLHIQTVTAFAQMQISTVSVNGTFGAFVECAGGTVTLLGITAPQLTAADFGF